MISKDLFTQEPYLLVPDALYTLATKPISVSLNGEVVLYEQLVVLGSGDTYRTFLSQRTLSENIIINIPPLTEERRLILIKQIKNEGEKGKISIRSVRKESNEYIKKLSNDGASEDEIRTGEDQIQKITNSYIEKIDNIIGIKEKELITI